MPAARLSGKAALPDKMSQERKQGGCRSCRRDGLGKSVLDCLPLPTSGQ
jgi:hypothetical protein